MSTQDRDREFSRRELLRAGWTLPIALSVGGLAACGGGGETHADLDADLLKKVRGKNKGGSTSTTSTSSTTSTTTPTSPATGSTAPSSPSGTTPRRGGSGSHTDVPHVDSGHGDVAAAAVPHVDEHGDAPESTHDDILAFERGEGPRFVTFPHFDVPHSDVPHADSAHVDAPHADTPHSDA